MILQKEKHTIGFSESIAEGFLNVLQPRPIELRTEEGDFLQDDQQPGERGSTLVQMRGGLAEQKTVEQRGQTQRQELLGGGGKCGELKR